MKVKQKNGIQFAREFKVISSFSINTLAARRQLRRPKMCSPVGKKGSGQFRTRAPGCFIPLLHLLSLLMTLQLMTMTDMGEITKTGSEGPSDSVQVSWAR